MRKKILTLETHRYILTVIRSLSKIGYDTIVGYHDQIDIKFIKYSWYSEETWPHPGFYEEKKFIEALMCLLEERNDIDYIFPLGDASSRVLARNYNKIDQFCGILMANPIAIETCIDKAMTCKLVCDLNIPLPETSVVRNLADLNTQIGKIGYPFVLKPKTLNLGVSFYGKKCIVCNSPDEFKKYFPKWPEKYQDLILQRKVSGIRYSCMFTSFKGNIISYFEEKTIRTDAYDGTGNAIDSVSSSPSKQRRDFSELLTRRLDYTGIGCIQFLANEEDGNSYFLEFNPRLDANIALPYFCGVDFPRQAIDVHQYLRNEIISLPQYSKGYPVGKRIHWLLGDMSGMLKELKKKEISILQGIVWMLRIIITLFRAPHHMTWSLKDPLPTLILYKQEFLNIIKNRLRIKS
jgi:biotin carboxylase